MEKRYIVIIIIFLILLLSFLFFIQFKNQQDNLNRISGKTIKEVPKNENPENQLENSDINNENSDITSETNETNSEQTSSNPFALSLPDIENSPCGFYFEEYGICGGKCPEGGCVQEGESCYCKIS